MKKVQIDYELFRKLIFYHLGSDDQYEEEIRNGLEEKLDALVRHELYTKYKTAPSEEEQEKARQEYLDKSLPFHSDFQQFVPAIQQSHYCIPTFSHHRHRIKLTPHLKQ